jgi:hypothetical protein
MNKQYAFLIFAVVLILGGVALTISSLYGIIKTSYYNSRIPHTMGYSGESWEIFSGPISAGDKTIVHVDALPGALYNTGGGIFSWTLDMSIRDSNGINLASKHYSGGIDEFPYSGKTLEISFPVVNDDYYRIQAAFSWDHADAPLIGTTVEIQKSPPNVLVLFSGLSLAILGIVALPLVFIRMRKH